VSDVQWVTQGLAVGLKGHSQRLSVTIDDVYIYVGPATNEGYHAAAQAFVEHLRGVVIKLRESEGS
jgi:hypothetical protein